MRSEAEREPRQECCGLLAGRDSAITAIYPAANGAANPATSYELAPRDLFRIMREIRAAKLELLGIYHSHPDCDAYFSETDLKNSCPWYSFVVLSIRNGAFDHANSWLPDAEQTKAEREELTY